MKFRFNIEEPFGIEYRLVNITKRFGDNVVLDNVSLDMPEKGILVISGPSGKGKTTLIRIMAGLIKQDSGEINGFEDKRKAFLFQEDRLLPWFNVLDNVTCVLKDEKKEDIARNWLNKFGLSGDLNKYPSELSGGMKRRVALARMFAFG